MHYRLTELFGQPISGEAYVEGVDDYMKTFTKARADFAAWAAEYNSLDHDRLISAFKGNAMEALRTIAWHVLLDAYPRGRPYMMRVDKLYDVIQSKPEAIYKLAAFVAVLPTMDTYAALEGSPLQEQFLDHACFFYSRYPQHLDTNFGTLEQVNE